MPSVALRGVDLWVRHGGRADGTPVVFLHGLGSSGTDWALQFPVFGERHCVLAVDLSGHGRSRPARGRLTMDRLARDVDAALDALGVQAAHVIGLSLGGCVGLALTLDDPARVRSLTLVNSFAKLRPNGPRGVARMLRRVATTCVAPMPVVAAQVAGALFPDPGQHELYRLAVASLAQNSRRTYLEAMAGLARFDARAGLPGIACPTLVLVGGRDRTVPRSAATTLCRGIAGAELVVVDDGGHALPYDHPEMFNRTVLDFIARVEKGNSPAGNTV